MGSMFIHYPVIPERLTPLPVFFYIIDEQPFMLKPVYYIKSDKCCKYRKHYFFLQKWERNFFLIENVEKVYLERPFSFKDKFQERI